MNHEITNKLSAVLNSDFIIVFGSMLNSTNEELSANVKQAVKENDAKIVYMHPIDDKKIQENSALYIKYEVGSEEGICALLLEYFSKNCDAKIKNYLDELDIGYLSAESSVGEEEFEDMVELSSNKTNKTLVLSRDLFTHEKIENITKLLAILNENSDFTIVVDPLVENGNIELIKCSQAECPNEVDELKAYDGTVIYNYKQGENNKLIGGASFARVAKISNNDKIVIKHGNKFIESIFEEDSNLQGTIALNVIDKNEVNKNSWINEGYSYKQVKIEKVNT